MAWTSSRASASVRSGSTTPSGNSSNRHSSSATSSNNCSSNTDKHGWNRNNTTPHYQAAALHPENSSSSEAYSSAFSALLEFGGGMLMPNGLRHCVVQLCSAMFCYRTCCPCSQASLCPEMRDMFLTHVLASSLWTAVPRNCCCSARWVCLGLAGALVGCS